MPLMDSFIDLLKKSSLIMKSCQWKSAEEKCREKKVKKKTTEENIQEYGTITKMYYTQWDYQKKKEKKDKYLRQ